MKYKSLILKTKNFKNSTHTQRKWKKLNRNLKVDKWHSKKPILKSLKFSNFLFWPGYGDPMLLLIEWKSHKITQFITKSHKITPFQCDFYIPKYTVSWPCTQLFLIDVICLCMSVWENIIIIVIFLNLFLYCDNEI